MQRKGAAQNPATQICWPQQWLPMDVPNCRVISIGYDIFLSKWFGSALPIEQQSLQIIKKLKLAQVGNRPIIWVAHSFGGLIVKEMMRYAFYNKEYKVVMVTTKC
jgi:hypothetical protein